MSGEPDSGAVDEAAVAVYFLQLREMIDACDETAEMRRTVQGSDVSGLEKSTQAVYLNRALCSDFIDGDRYEGANFGWNEPNEDDVGRREDDERANGGENYTDGLVNQLNVTSTANSQTATMSSPTSQQVADTTRSIVHNAQNDPRRQIVRNAPPPPHRAAPRGSSPCLEFVSVKAEPWRVVGRASHAHSPVSGWRTA